MFTPYNVSHCPLSEVCTNSRVPTVLWLLKLSFDFLFTEGSALGRE